MRVQLDEDVESALRTLANSSRRSISNTANVVLREALLRYEKTKNQIDKLLGRS